MSAIIHFGHSKDCKSAKIILIPKPRKTSSKLSSYRLTNLLPIRSTVFERLLIKKNCRGCGRKN